MYSKVRVEGETTRNAEEIVYELPDGTKIPLKDEPLRYSFFSSLFPFPLIYFSFLSFYRVTASLFNPTTLSTEQSPPLLGFADMIVNTIQSVSVDEPSWQPKDLGQSHIGSLPHEILSSINQYVRIILNSF